MTLPIIRLEITHMKQAILAALSERSLNIDAFVKEALENVCSDQNVSRVVNEEARKQIDLVLREEVRSFFKFGAGRKALKVAIGEYLERMYPEEESYKKFCKELEK